MKRLSKPIKLSEAQEDYNNAIVGLCCICQKPVKGSWYGRWGSGGTCNKTCEVKQEAMPEYPNYSEEDFLQRFNLE